MAITMTKFKEPLTSEPKKIKHHQIKEFDPHKGWMITMRRNGKTAQQIRVALEARGLEASISTVKRLLSYWEPKHRSHNRDVRDVYTMDERVLRLTTEKATAINIVVEGCDCRLGCLYERGGTEDRTVTPRGHTFASSPDDPPSIEISHEAVTRRVIELAKPIFDASEPDLTDDRLAEELFEKLGLGQSFANSPALHPVAEREADSERYTIFNDSVTLAPGMTDSGYLQCTMEELLAMADELGLEPMEDGTWGDEHGDDALPHPEVSSLERTGFTNAATRSSVPVPTASILLELDTNVSDLEKARYLLRQCSDCYNRFQLRDCFNYSTPAASILNNRWAPGNAFDLGRALYYRSCCLHLNGRRHKEAIEGFNMAIGCFRQSGHVNWELTTLAKLAPVQKVWSAPQEELARTYSQILQKLRSLREEFPQRQSSTIQASKQVALEELTSRLPIPDRPNVYLRILNSALSATGQRSYRTASAMNALGTALLLCHEYDKALEWTRKSYDIYLSLYGPLSPSTISVAGHLLLHLNALGRFLDALAFLEELPPELLKSKGWWTPLRIVVVGRISTGLGIHHEARKLFLKGFGDLKASLREGSTTLLEVQGWIVEELNKGRVDGFAHPVPAAVTENRDTHYAIYGPTSLDAAWNYLEHHGCPGLDLKSDRLGSQHFDTLGVYRTGVLGTSNLNPVDGIGN